MVSMASSPSAGGSGAFLRASAALWYRKMGRTNRKLSSQACLKTGRVSKWWAVYASLAGDYGPATRASATPRLSMWPSSCWQHAADSLLQHALCRLALVHAITYYNNAGPVASLGPDQTRNSSLPQYEAHSCLQHATNCRCCCWSHLAPAVFVLSLMQLWRPLASSPHVPATDDGDLLPCRSEHTLPPQPHKLISLPTDGIPLCALACRVHQPL